VRVRPGERRPAFDDDDVDGGVDVEQTHDVLFRQRRQGTEDGEARERVVVEAAQHRRRQRAEVVQHVLGARRRVTTVGRR
jgi:hypothetical protein